VPAEACLLLLLLLLLLWGGEMERNCIGHGQQALPATASNSVEAHCSQRCRAPFAAPAFLCCRSTRNWSSDEDDSDDDDE
jgi:hypothetical protein